MLSEISHLHFICCGPVLFHHPVAYNTTLQPFLPPLNNDYLVLFLSCIMSTPFRNKKGRQTEGEPETVGRSNVSLHFKDNFFKLQMSKERKQAAWLMMEKNGWQVGELLKCLWGVKSGGAFSYTRVRGPTKRKYKSMIRGELSNADGGVFTFQKRDVLCVRKAPKESDFAFIFFLF